MLTKYLESKTKCNWDNLLDTCTMAYNTSRHASTTFTPFELLFGRKAYLPVDINSNNTSADEHLQEWKKMEEMPVEELTEKRQHLCQTAKSKIKKAQKEQKYYYDLKHSKPSVFAVGSKVLLKDLTRKKRRGGKLDTKWRGPYRIIRDVGKGIYWLALPALKIKKVSGSHLKAYRTPPKSPRRKISSKELSYLPMNESSNLQSSLNQSASSVESKFQSSVNEPQSSVNESQSSLDGSKFQSSVNEPQSSVNESQSSVDESKFQSSVNEPQSSVNESQSLVDESKFQSSANEPQSSVNESRSLVNESKFLHFSKSQSSVIEYRKSPDNGCHSSTKPSFLACGSSPSSATLLPSTVNWSLNETCNFQVTYSCCLIGLCTCTVYMHNQKISCTICSSTLIL